MFTHLNPPYGPHLILGDRDFNKLEFTLLKKHSTYVTALIANLDLT